MSRFISWLKIINNRLGFFLGGRKVDFGSFKIIKPYDAVDAYMTDVQTEGFKSACIDDLTTQIMYEGLLVSQKVRSDYSDGLYYRMEDELKIPYQSLTFNVMDHIASTFLKSFRLLDAAFIQPSYRIRYVLKCSTKRPHCFLSMSAENICTHLPLAFKNKKLLILTDHPDLFQVQFSRLKSEDLTKEKYNYSLLALDLGKIVQNTDRSLYFESLDAISMALLNYSFDVILIHADVYSLSLIDFLNKLGIPSFIIDDNVYGMYGIVRKHSELSQDSTRTLLALEDYDNETRLDFVAASVGDKGKMTRRKKSGKK